MKPYYLSLCIAFFYLHSFHLEAQNTYAVLEKNVNLRASSLHHNLNITRDTLILNSRKKINYIYTIHKNIKLGINTYINDYEYAMPLQHLEEGKHVIVVGQSSLKIVFILKIFKQENEKIIALIND